MSLTSILLYILLAFVCLLWLVQLFLLLSIYHRVNHDAKGRGLFPVRKKADKASRARAKKSAPEKEPLVESPSAISEETAVNLPDEERTLPVEENTEERFETSLEKHLKEELEAPSVDSPKVVIETDIQKSIEEEVEVQKEESIEVVETPAEDSPTENTPVKDSFKSVINKSIEEYREGSVEEQTEEQTEEQANISAEVCEDIKTNNLINSYIEESAKESVEAQADGVVATQPTSPTEKAEEERTETPIETAAEIIEAKPEAEPDKAIDEATDEAVVATNEIADKEEKPIEGLENTAEAKEEIKKEEKPVADEDGFFGDLFGMAVPRKQPTTGRKRAKAEEAEQDIVDELVISEKELQHGPQESDQPTLFADDPNEASCPVRSDAPMLSVIMVACNQDRLLRHNLPALLSQDYPNYEVIVVDDNSNDDTADVLMHMMTEYPHLQTRTTPASARRVSRRKLSLMLGIKAAKGQWLVFTEAYCRPLSRHWLSTLASHVPTDLDPLHSDIDAVIGYTAYAPGKGLSDWLCCYDNMMRQVRLLGMALRGDAPLAYGSNLLYRRDLFFEGKGYSAHLDLERGDDDLFVNDNILPARIRAEIDGRAVILNTDNDVRHHIVELLGRIATGRYLHGFMVHVMHIDTITRGLYAYATLAAMLLAAITQAWIILGIIAALWGIRYAIQWVELHRVQQLLGEGNYAPWTPFLELAHPIWALSLRLRFLFTPGNTWRRKTL